jgi:hypothetical protein
MTVQVTAATAQSPYRFAGWAGITSGVIGILAFGFLIAALVGRISSGDERTWEILIRSHDVGVILQSVFLLPVVLAVKSLGHQQSASVGRATAAVGVAALSLVVLFLLLTFVKVWDAMYMIPQGVLGVWLIVVNRQATGVFPRSLTRLGQVSGVGLLLVGAFPISYAIFVDPIGFHGPVPFDSVPPQAPTANAIVHIVLLIGTFMGVTTYPIWAALLGRRLLRMRNS